MKFDITVKKYLVETTKSHPPTQNFKSGDLYVTVLPNGDTFYYKDADRNINHREDGPAVEFANGYLAWFKNGKRHRSDGPAREWKNNNVKNFKPEWWMNGVLLTDEQVEDLKKKLAIKNDIQSHKNNRIDPGMLEDYL